MGLAILVLAVTLLAALLVHSIRRSSTVPASEVPILSPKATTIAPGLHLLGRLAPSAAYVVETRDGLVLVDSGLASDAGSLKAQMKDLGLDWRRVVAILLTHVHGDHSGGAEHLRNATGAKVYVGRGDAPALKRGGPREAFFSTFYMPLEKPHPTKVDVELEGGETIVLGGVRFRAIATPGHTPGSVCYLMERGPLRALFSGDVIMMIRGDEKPQSELGKPLGTYAAYLAPRYGGDAKTFLSSLHQLRALPVPDLVLPGHPRADPTSQSPALSQTAWEAMLEQGIREMEQLLARYEADGALFLDDEPKRLMPDLYYLGDFQNRAVYAFFASSKFFVVDAPGGRGLVEFLHARLRKLGLSPAEPAAVLLTSCGPGATAGLRELIERCRVTVVAPPQGIRIVQEACPAGTVVASADDLQKLGGLPGKPVPLHGRGLAPMAYLFSWSQKTVLFSGQIPIKVNYEAREALLSDFLEARGDVAQYCSSLHDLRAIKPHLWLPAVPSDGQNANLYDNEWEQIIADNRVAIEKDRRLIGCP
jgi:glyoxylase-like metal-dependent hydrolase (beta-lactamase superfamily II)